MKIFRDFFLNARNGSGRQGNDWNRAQLRMVSNFFSLLQVVLAKVVTPLADTMSFVHGYTTQVQMRQSIQKSARHELLGCDIHQSIVTSQSSFFFHTIELGRTQVRC